jgi:hypothetical protein
MRILLDEDVPVQVLEILRRVLQTHDVDHVEALHWKGKKDAFLIADAAAKGYDMLLTNNRRQLSDPRECVAIKRSRIHHVLYDQAPKLRGLALAVAAIVAAMPMLIEELEKERGQRLARVQGLRPTRRFDIIDPKKNPPQYWPR